MKLLELQIAKNNKKKMMQIVNLKLIILLYISLNSINAQAQDLTPTNNSGGYTMEKQFPKSDKSKDSIVIVGKVKDLESGRPIAFAKLNYLCNKLKVNNKGEFKFREEINDFKKNHLIASALGYKPIRTEFFEVSEKMILKVHFYLEEDKLPLINCEGQTEK